MSRRARAAFPARLVGCPYCFPAGEDDRRVHEIAREALSRGAGVLALRAGVHTWVLHLEQGPGAVRTLHREIDWSLQTEDLISRCPEFADNSRFVRVTLASTDGKHD